MLLGSAGLTGLDPFQAFPSQISFSIDRFKNDRDDQLDRSSDTSARVPSNWVDLCLLVVESI